MHAAVPTRVLGLLQVGETAQQVAQFLKANPEGLLDRAMIGEFLGDPKEFHVSVMHAYVDAMDFAGMAFDEAIRHFLAGFRLPGEAQKVHPAGWPVRSDFPLVHHSSPRPRRRCIAREVANMLWLPNAVYCVGDDSGQSAKVHGGCSIGY